MSWWLALAVAAVAALLAFGAGCAWTLRRERLKRAELDAAVGELTRAGPSS
jgi:hypothetical protein